jgi:hypothetical protein
LDPDHRVTYAVYDVTETLAPVEKVHEPAAFVDVTLGFA